METRGSGKAGTSALLAGKWQSSSVASTQSASRTLRMGSFLLFARLGHFGGKLLQVSQEREG
jgi:hypothetical protein